MPEKTELFQKVIASIVLIAVGEFWIKHHFGLGRETPWVSTAITAFSGGVAFFGWLNATAQKQAIKWIRRKIDRVLTAHAIIGSYAIFVVLALIVSSVMVIPESAADSSGKRLKVGLTSVDRSFSDEDYLGPGGKAARFVVLTNPFGRPFRLGVEGYLEYALTVYPIVGAKVTPERDLRVAPSLLLRPPLIALRSLEDGGYLTLAWKQAGGSTPLIAPDRGYRGSFLIGRAQTAPDAKVARWKLELEGGGFPQKLMSQTLLEWNSPRVLSTSSPLMPGMIVVAEIRSRADALVARAERTVSSERLIDVGMLPVEE